jgi:ABC-type transporter Mla maintaining outer membrane lipid asymmetry ATPase subunit MlaF
MENSDFVLEINGLSVSYGNRTVLRDVNLQVKKVYRIGVRSILFA